jgi:hypothetical protein
MRHGRSDYQRIQDPAADAALLEAYDDAVALLTSSESVQSDPQTVLAHLVEALDDFMMRALREHEPSAIPRDEPVFLLRAKDQIAPVIVREYARQLRQVMPGGTDMWKASDRIIDVAITMEAWQVEHGAKLPDVPVTRPEPVQS